jgi:hypothetical protein
VLYWVNQHRRTSRCLSWRWDGWRPVRCTWPYWHATHSKYHCDERTTGKVWYVSKAWRPRGS